MKRVAIALLALASVAMLAAPAMATNLLLENFSYSDGALVTVSAPNWIMHSGTWTALTDIQVVSGYAEGNMANSPDDNRVFPAQTATSRTYSCMKVRIPNPGLTPGMQYFAHFKDSGTSNFRARVFVAPLGGTFTFGISAASSTPTLWSTALSYDTWYTVATSYDAATGLATMWVDPVDESSASVTSGDVSIGLVVSSYALRQSNSGISGATWKFDVDDLGVGTAFIDACPAPVPVENSTWGHIKSMYN